jgi:hypothetical protein
MTNLCFIPLVRERGQTPFVLYCIKARVPGYKLKIFLVNNKKTPGAHSWRQGYR